MASGPRPEFVPRGIWKGYHKRDGHATIIAVDREKRCLGEIVMHPGVEASWVRRVLTELLQMVDPVPELAIVRDEGGRPAIVSEREPLPAWPKREGEPHGLSPAATLLLYRRS